VWTFLYVIIFFSFGGVFLMLWKGHIAFIVALPFILNLIFNFSFIPLQFWLRNNVLAAIDILLVFATILWAMIVIFPLSQWIAYFQIPYVLWVSFATILQLTITYLNS